MGAREWVAALQADGAQVASGNLRPFYLPPDAAVDVFTGRVLS
jgi:hypothetical protein